MKRRVVNVALVMGLMTPALTGGLASAEWTLLDEPYETPGVQMVYVDRDSITQEDGLRTVSVLIDWATMQGGRSPSRFYSTIVRKQVDCPNKLVRPMAFADYDGHRGTGKRVAHGEQGGPWRPVESGSVNEGIWHLICGHDAPP
ncbi:MAG: hypothetical protein NNA25_07910 [Nitrospira sp.]|nr:hypothetical protein [Nitrospira sp.]